MGDPSAYRPTKKKKNAKLYGFMKLRDLDGSKYPRRFF